MKGERGLGFSILDYQDPLRPSHTLVVIRSLVPGGVAQQDGRLIPGDRLLFVNDQVTRFLRGCPNIGASCPICENFGNLFQNTYYKGQGAYHQRWK